MYLGRDVVGSRDQDAFGSRCIREIKRSRCTRLKNQDVLGSRGQDVLVVSVCPRINMHSYRYALVSICNRVDMDLYQYVLGSRDRDLLGWRRTRIKMYSD
jgi:hypothetical protein